MTTPVAERFLQKSTEKRGGDSTNLVKTCLSGMMGLAVCYGAIKHNPIREVSRVATVTPEPRALSGEEVKALRAQIRRDKAAIRADLPDVVDLMLATGCRTGEALAIRWQDVDLAEGTVAVTGKIVRHLRQGITREDTTKSKNVARKRLPKWAVSMPLDRRVNGLPSGLRNLVFPTADETPRDISNVDKQWRNYRTRHPEWKWVVPKTFRKTAGTIINETYGIETAAAQLDHSSPAVTRKHYAQTPRLGPDTRAALEEFAISADRRSEQTGG
ncbi:MAG: tyrosine-type recombinase/integrase [Bifidobacteriaceae bacterium]|nr:tyrosine-type recombinase/integrase [Bifidobacteriaceae bacterium]